MWQFGCNSCHGRKKNCTTSSLNSLVDERLVFIFSAILCEFYLIIVYDLKAKYTIKNFRMFMFDSNHSLLYIPMHCKVKKKVRDLVFESFIKMTSWSVLLGSLTSRIQDSHAYRSGVKVGNGLLCTIEPGYLVREIWVGTSKKKKKLSSWNFQERLIFT